MIASVEDRVLFFGAKKWQKKGRDLGFSSVYPMFTSFFYAKNHKKFRKNIDKFRIVC